MKANKLFYAISLILSVTTSSIHGQAIRKEAFISIHTLTVTLNPGVTMEEFTEFYLKKIIPDYEKNIPEVKFFLLKAMRGENTGKLSVLWIAESEKVRDKYHNADGRTELAKVARQNMQPIQDQLNKLATITETYTDWVVQ